ncbi:hypothetical protein A4E84_20345 [Streptomyces qaidamensis]|uniref:Uncharacterized protein n=1 Tax=Streptomyces qaidamensis TaxID=1783515 RepID=A0A143C2C8_9ACTN|nr:hypothetical protein [Streptomyces qaidamensis]AMW11637.1 hypothetical protein A4E84_20345 [Streptomyces qaidamensis]
MIAEAFDTLITLGWGLAAWIVLLALAATLALYAVLASVWWSLRALWRGLGRPTWSRNRLRARLYARRTRHDYEEAA